MLVFSHVSLSQMFSCSAPSQAEKQFELVEMEPNNSATQGIISWLASGLSIEESQ
jgi:hypothetical protein